MDWLLLSLSLHDLLRAIHAAIANVDPARSCQQLLNLVFGLVTKRTTERRGRFSVPHAVQLLSLENRVLHFALVFQARTPPEKYTPDLPVLVPSMSALLIR